MPRKPTLSPTKITTYLACPVKYRWTYVDPRGKFYLRAKSYYSFGSTLHRVLQRFHDSGDAGVQTVSQAVHAVEQEWVAQGYASEAEANEARAEGQRIVASYVEAAERAPVAAKTLFLERMLRCDMGEFDLIGRLDRVDEREDGAIEVIDYKSGRASVAVEEVASDLAMGCYQLLLRRQFPDRRVMGTILAIRTGVSASYEMPDSEMAEFDRDLRQLGGQILATEFENLLPTFKKLCLSCDFVPLCKKHGEFEQEFAAAVSGPG